MAKLNCEISDYVQIALRERSRATGESIDRIVANALSRVLGMPVHTLFQVLTSGALVQWIYERAVSTSLLEKYGDFGQPEFDFRDTVGTLVGIWAPEFSSSLNIAGYHFHFLSDDRTEGGHLLECSGKHLRGQVERLNDFHLCLPESEEFLRADLTQDPSEDLAYAEQAHRKENPNVE
jgi:alpha-acetolactate decarboxylase